MEFNRQPVFEKNFLPIVFSTDENYIMYVGVAVKSLIENADKEMNYDIVIFESDVSEIYKRFISNMQTENVSIRFFDILSYLGNRGIDEFEDKYYWSASAYYRVLIPELFSNYKQNGCNKVLYTDCDVFFQHDLKELYNTNLKGYKAGVIVDMDSVTFTKKRKEYIRNVLKLNDEKKYFNSGVILFNLDEIDESTLFDKFLTKYVTLDKKGLMFPDQDLLNVIWEDEVKYLDFRWNYQTGLSKECLEHYTGYKFEHMSIIHFTSCLKPWKAPGCYGGYEWWSYARRTQFYEEILFKSRNPYSGFINYTNVKLNLNKYKLFKHFVTGKTKERYKRKYKYYNDIMKNYKNYV